MTEHMIISVEKRVQTIRFNRPEKKNALTPAMYAAAADALADAARRDDICASVVLGSGGSFTAGNDLGDFAAAGTRKPPKPGEPMPPVARFLRAIATHPKPLLAGVDGIAVGVGVTMLLHCDFVVAAETAKFQTPFVNLGLVPEAASSLILPRIAGYQRAAEILLFADMFGPALAHEAGFVNRVVAAAELEDSVLKHARAIAAKPPEAIRLAKSFLKGDLGEITKRMDAESEVFGRRLGSAEAKEAFAAFFERRAPDFAKLKTA